MKTIARFRSAQDASKLANLIITTMSIGATAISNTTSLIYHWDVMIEDNISVEKQIRLDYLVLGFVNGSNK
jgi:hypothetical protein